MNKPELIELSNIAFQASKFSLTTLPQPYKIKYHDDTPSGLSKCIMDYVILRGGSVEREERNSLTIITAFICGKCLKIEINNECNYQDVVIGGNGTYYMAKDYPSFKNWFDSNVCDYG